MRWMLIGLLISVLALLALAGAAARYIRRQREVRPDEAQGTKAEDGKGDA